MSNWTTNPWSSIPSKYKITVTDNQTIQSVIDALPAMQGDLVSGITNPYIVYVPPGHEKEYYSLVRDASDAASDKRNVKVVFMDNPDNKFKTDLFNSCESLDGWVITNAIGSLDNNNQFTGENCIKLINDDSSIVALQQNNMDLDWREYQGILIDVNFSEADFSNVQLRVFDTDNNYTYISNAFLGTEDFIDSMYFPFTPYSDTYPDFEHITSIQIKITPATSAQKNIYIDNIRLVRTNPASVAILRFDDNKASQWKYINELDERGWKGCFLCRGEYIDVADNLTNEQLKHMHANGHSIINHTMSHPMPFSEISNMQALYEVMANYNWQILNGFKNGFPFFVAPGGDNHPESKRCVRRQGGMTLYRNQNAFPSDILALNSPSYSLTKVEEFINSQRGGIVQIMMHDLPDASIAAYKTALVYIETHFSYVISVDRVPQLFPEDWPIKFTPNFTLYDCGKVETLTENTTIKPYEGTEFFFDAGGAVRDIIPIADKGTVFQLGAKIRIINTADDAETLTFDPLFTSSGAHDGTANADTLTDSGESWVTGQLVGRTVNNITDGSSGVITANTATTITAVLSGGTNNTWTAGDSFTITPVGSNQDITQGNSQLFVYDGEGWH